MARTQDLKFVGGNRSMLLLALVAGLVAAALVFVAISNNDGESGGSTAVGGDVQSAVVAAQAIGAGDEITAEMVKVVDIPIDLVIAGGYSDADLVVGDVARVALAEGEQIVSSRIGVPTPEKGLAGVIPVGMRAVAISVQEVTAVGGLLLPGDRIDVLAAYKIDKAPGLAEDEYILRTETILQDVEILSVAQEAQDASARVDVAENPDAAGTTYTSGELPDDVEEQPGAGTITVALSPADAQLVVSKQQHADRVWAIERAYGDTGRADVAPLDVILVGDNN